jgi:hypothetical protein
MTRSGARALASALAHQVTRGATNRRTAPYRRVTTVRPPRCHQPQDNLFPSQRDAARTGALHKAECLSAPAVYHKRRRRFLPARNDGTSAPEHLR